MPKKIDQYINERKAVIDRLLVILGINEGNNMFSLHKIDEDNNIQQQILDLEPEIKKYFICGEWSCFKKKNSINRRWLSFIKYLLKDMNIKLEKSIIIGKAGQYGNSGTLYFINK
jgi:hypothetical protein